MSDEHEKPTYVEDRDIIERVKVMPLQPGDLVVFELVAGTSQSQAHEFCAQLDKLQGIRPDITFAAMHELEGVRVLRHAEIPGYLGGSKIFPDPKRQGERGSHG